MRDFWLSENLRQRYAKVEAISNPAARGAAFEALIQHLLESEKFLVVRNPGVALPRQTDLFAAYGDSNFLIETKWQNKPIDIDDLDSLLARLRRTTNPLC